MKTLSAAAVLIAAMCVGAAAQQPSNAPLNGVWTLNRSLSEFPNEIGFNLDVQTSPDGAPPATPSGRGRRGGGGDNRGASGPFSGRRESFEDGQRKQLITSEARNPPVRLMFVDNGAAVVVTNELGQSRTMHPSGRPDSIDVQGVAFQVTSQREADRLVATYQIEQDRQVRYTYAPSAETPRRLSVQVEFIERGTVGDKATRVYEFGTDSGSVAANRPASALPPGGGGSASSRNEPARETFDQRPGAEFRGIKDVGILVEDLGPEAQQCGLKHDALEDSLSKRLAGGGLNVRRNSDEDTYLYVNIITTATPTGSCVSRYDAFLYTHGTAKLSYREQPVLVQVSLMHRGGISASGIASHAAAVSRGLEGYVDVFLTQIANANK
jgi:hypothetical protein